ncbi:ATP-binding protein [Archaeoglobus sp.]
MKIAVTGKGGVGKTVISALLTKYFSKLGDTLAVDADPDSNLADVLGVEVEKTVSDVVDELYMKKYEIEDKDRWFEAKINEVIHEDEFDLIVMGKKEREGCYCYINSLLKKIMQKVVDYYDYVVVDCEAGIEILSRKTIDFVDAILVVVNKSKLSRDTAERIKKLVKELGIQAKVVVVGNKGAKGDFVIPFSEKIEECLELGKPLELFDDVRKSIEDLVEGLKS